jgi:predicted ribosome quality control (RQC) complex YloA/Tae2 family protein
VRVLARDINLGGEWAERLLSEIGIEKGRLAWEVEDEEIEQILTGIKGLFKQVFEPQPILVKEATGGENKALLAFKPAGGPQEGEVFEDGGSLSQLVDQLWGSSPPLERGEGAPVPGKSKLERQWDQMVEAISEFEEEAAWAQTLGDLIYAHYGHVSTSLQQVKEGAEKLGWQEVKNRAVASDLMGDVDPKRKSFKLYLELEGVIKTEGEAEETEETEGQKEPGEPEEQERVIVDIFVEDGVEGSAARYYDQSKKLRHKREGALEALERTEENMAREAKRKKKAEEHSAVARKKRFWFERYKWFVTSDGHLVLAGRDAKTNDDLVKKRLKFEDRYIHAEVHGAPSVVVKGDALGRPPVRLTEPLVHEPEEIEGEEDMNEEDPDDPEDEGAVSLEDAEVAEVEVEPEEPEEYGDGELGMAEREVVDSDGEGSIPVQSLTEACQFGLIHSRAWRPERADGEAFWVRPGQVSKTAESGEHLGKGAFVVRGKRNYVRHLDLKLALGLVDLEGETILMAGPPGAIEFYCEEYLVISPGRQGKDKFATGLARFLHLPQEEVARLLPPGPVSIAGGRGWGASFQHRWRS